MCAMVVMPGHLIMLQANNINYEFHTNENGSEIQPATLALTWKRNGGIAGFCDSLTIYLSGEANADNCKADMRNGNLLPAEVTQLETWVMQFGQVNLDQSDPANVSDRMHAPVFTIWRWKHSTEQCRPANVNQLGARFIPAIVQIKQNSR